MSTTKLPQNLGAVVEADWCNLRRTFLRGGPQRWAPWRFEFEEPKVDITNERTLTNVKVLSEGWAEPTPEPTGEAAVARCARGFVRHAIDNPDTGVRTWHHTDGSGAGIRWDVMPQPAEVLFEGVSE